MKDWECIGLNDGSKDGSAALCDSFAVADNRVKVLHKENAGAAMARLSGLQLSTGEVVCFVDSDDYIAQGSILALVEALDDDVDVVIGVQVSLYGEREVVRPMSAGYLTQSEYINQTLHHHQLDWGPCGKLFRRELFAKESFVAIKNCEDLLMTLDIASRVRKVRKISSVVYYYYQHEMSASHSYVTTLVDERNLCSLIEKVLRRHDVFEVYKESYLHFALTRIFLYSMQRASAVSFGDSWVREIYHATAKSPLSMKDRARRWSLRCRCIRYLFKLKRK